MGLNKIDDLVIRESFKAMHYRIKNVGNIRMIIAMKGDSYTGKTTCANAIAKAYNCSVVCFDSILDSLCPSAPSSPQEQEGLIDLAFKVVLRVVRLQLKARRPVVIDSPLSKQSHLDQLLAVGDEFQLCSYTACKGHHCRSVIVECRPESKYTWEQRFDSRGSRVDTDYNKWYKPQEWRHVVQTESVEDYPPERLPGHVSRLIVDTTGCVPAKYRHLGAATLDSVECLYGHVLNFRYWHPQNPYHLGFNPIYAIGKFSGRVLLPRSGQDPELESPVWHWHINCGEDGRHLLEQVTGVEEGSLGCCKACHGPISYPAERAYRCTRCKLALHSKCAELEDKAMISELPAFLRIVSSAEEFYSSIPEEYKERFKCSLCKEFSVDCEFCLWEMHLGARDVPTIVRHEGHHDGSHPIGFWIVSRPNVDRHGYLCEACKLPGFCAGYTCLHGTFTFNCHVECALLPRPMSHVHGGHHHDMELVFGTREIKEDYMCNVCLEPILNPKAWYFYCVECDFTSHLHCIYKND